MGRPPRLDEPLLARIRYHSPLTPARVTALDGGHFSLAFERPVQAVAPGQAVVLYRPDREAGDEVVGGGSIESTGATPGA